MSEAEAEDLELRREIQYLREQRDLTKARVLDDKNPIKEDNLRWLLDKEENGGSLLAAGAQEAEGELEDAAAEVTKQRVAYGTLRNNVLQRTKKLEKLKDELRVLRQANAETDADRRFVAEVTQRHDATLARVEEMERMADEQADYSLTLDLLTKRLHTEKGGGEGMLATVREKMAEVEHKTEQQMIANGSLSHASWQAKNGAKVQVELNDNGRRARQQLVTTRRRILERGRGEIVTATAELERKQEELRQSAAQQSAAEEVRRDVVLLQEQQAAGRLRRLEEEFAKVQELMGFSATKEEVVERVLEQQQAGQRMAAMKVEVTRRHEELLEEKAKMDVLQEGQAGGVDTELSKRRAEYDEVVEAAEEHQEAINRRRGRVAELTALLMRARVGVAQLEQKLSAVPRVSLRRGAASAAPVPGAPAIGSRVSFLVPGAQAPAFGDDRASLAGDDRASVSNLSVGRGSVSNYPDRGSGFDAVTEGGEGGAAAPRGGEGGDSRASGRRRRARARRRGGAAAAREPADRDARRGGDQQHLSQCGRTR